MSGWLRSDNALLDEFSKGSRAVDLEESFLVN